MGIRSCLQGQGCSIQPFSLCSGQLGDLFRFPCKRCPDHVDRISCLPSVSTPIHSVIAFEVTDDRFDLDPLHECSSEPGLLAVRMWLFPFLRNRYPFCSPSLPAVLLLLNGLIKTPISGDIIRGLTGVPLDAGNHPPQGLHIRHVPLILLMGKDQTVAPPVKKFSV